MFCLLVATAWMEAKRFKSGSTALRREPDVFFSQPFWRLQKKIRWFCPHDFQGDFFHGMVMENFVEFSEKNNIHHGWISSRCACCLFVSNYFLDFLLYLTLQTSPPNYQPKNKKSPKKWNVSPPHAVVSSVATVWDSWNNHRVEVMNLANAQKLGDFCARELVCAKMFVFPFLGKFPSWYCWWKKKSHSQPPFGCMYETLVNNGINYLFLNWLAGFLEINSIKGMVYRSMNGWFCMVFM